MSNKTPQEILVQPTLPITNFCDSRVLQQQDSQIEMNEVNSEVGKLNVPDWQWSIKSFESKLMYLYDKKHLNDVSFIVGKDAEKISAHKLVLACHSPVFESMFYGSLPEGDKVHLPDDEPSLFHLMLKCIYSHVGIQSTMQATQLYAIADKYRIKDIMDNAEVYIEHNLDVNNTLNMLNFAKFYEIQQLIEACLGQWVRNGSEILKSPAFLDINVDLIEELFGTEELYINSEIELVEAFAKYVDKHKNDDEFKNYDKWRVLSKIRFLSIEPKEIAKCTALKSLISESDYCKIMDCTLLSNHGDIPQYVNKDQMRRGAKSYIFSINTIRIKRSAYNSFKSDGNNTIDIKVMFFQNSTIVGFGFVDLESLQIISVQLKDEKPLEFSINTQNDNISMILKPSLFVERYKWKVITIEYSYCVFVYNPGRHGDGFSSKDLVLELTESCEAALNSMMYLK